jgi:hypothetical protein
MGPTESEHDPWFVGVFRLAESRVLDTLVKAEKGCPEGRSDRSEMNLVSLMKRKQGCIGWERHLERCSRP